MLQTKVADGWACYQAKNTRSPMYAADARLAELQGAPGATLAHAWTEKAGQERESGDEILCSIALPMGTRLFWQILSRRGAWASSCRARLAPTESLTLGWSFALRSPPWPGSCLG